MSELVVSYDTVFPPELIIMTCGKSEGSKEGQKSCTLRTIKEEEEEGGVGVGEAGRRKEGSVSRLLLKEEDRS